MRQHSCGFGTELPDERPTAKASSANRTKKSRPRPAVARLGTHYMLGFVKRHRLLLALLVVSTLVAAIAAKLNTSGNLVVAGATSHVLVDDPDLSIVDRTALPQDLQALQTRAELYGGLMTTKPVLDAIAKRAGIPADQISGVADITAERADPVLRSRQRGACEPARGLECAVPARATSRPLRADPVDLRRGAVARPGAASR